jgi:hypothetical protein
MACPNCQMYMEREKDLLEEIQRLYLKQYWMFKTIEYLLMELDALHQRLRRTSSAEEQEADPCQCTFIFLQFLDQLGLSYAIASAADANTHFILPYAPASYCGMEYGPALTEAKYNSEALGKLDRLFELLFVSDTQAGCLPLLSSQ